MKKLVIIISVLFVLSVNTQAQDNPERFNLSYSMYNTIGDQQILSGGDSIVKVGSGVKHSLSTEVFIGNRVYRPGIYFQYNNSNFLTDQFQAQKSWSYNMGIVSQINFSWIPVEIKIYTGFFNKHQKISGYDSESKKFSDSARINGLDLGINLIIAQQDINLFPKIELFGNGKFQFSRSMSGKMVPKGYSFGANIDIYRISFFDYYVSPFVGIYKIEEMDSYRNLIYKLGISLNNNIVRSDIAKVGAFLSWNNNVYSYQTKNYNYSVKNAVVGIFLQVNPIGLFSQYVR